MIKIKQPKFLKTISYLEKLEKLDPRAILEEYGRLGVQALSNSTPVDTGMTASSWSYKIEGTPKRYKLIWTNTEVAGQAPLVLLLQYGHMSKSGYFIPGVDFINPALKPIYLSLAKRLGQEVLP